MHRCCRHRRRCELDVLVGLVGPHAVDNSRHDLVRLRAPTRPARAPSQRGSARRGEERAAGRSGWGDGGGGGGLGGEGGMGHILADIAEAFQRALPQPIVRAHHLFAQIPLATSTLLRLHSSAKCFSSDCYRRCFRAQSYSHLTECIGAVRVRSQLLRGSHGVARCCRALSGATRCAVLQHGALRRLSLCTRRGCVAVANPAVVRLVCVLRPH